MSEDRVQIDVARRRRDVRMVRADKHNALDWPMFKALGAVTEELAKRDDVPLRRALRRGAKLLFRPRLSELHGRRRRASTR